MSTAKDISKEYRQQKEEIIKTEEKITGLSKRKEGIDQEMSSLNEKFINAESDKKKTLEQFALGEVPQSEVEKTKGIFLQLQQAIAERQEMISILETKIQDFQQELNAQRHKLKDAEKMLWRAIFDDLVTEIRKTVGQNIEKCFLAYQQGGRPGFGFLAEIFGANFTLPPEKLQRIRAEIAREYGL